MDDLDLIKVRQWITDLNNQVNLDYKGREQVQLLEYMLDEIEELKPVLTNRLFMEEDNEYD